MVEYTEEIFGTVQAEVCMNPRYSKTSSWETASRKKRRSLYFIEPGLLTLCPPITFGAHLTASCFDQA